MRNLIRQFVVLIAVIVSTDAFAQTPLNLLPAQKGWVARIAETLQSVQTSRSRFEQISPDGQRSTGTVWLHRPGKMRFEFDKPSALLIVANGGNLVYQDKDLGQVTTIPLDQTPLGLLLASKVAFSQSVTVTGFVDDGREIHLTVVQLGRPEEGSLTLDVQKNPLTLLGWHVVDAQDRETEVRLTDTRSDIQEAPGLFTLPQSSD